MGSMGQVYFVEPSSGLADWVPQMQEQLDWFQTLLAEVHIPALATLQR